MATGIVTPYDFGGNTNIDTTVNHGPVVNAVAAAFASWDGRSFKLDVDLQGQNWYLGNNSVVLNNIRQPGFTIKNGTLWGSGEDTILLNGAGANAMKLQNLHLHGDPNDPPSFGYVGFRTSQISYGISPDLKALEVETDGSFRQSAWVNMSNEVGSFTQCKFYNKILSNTAMTYCNVSEYGAIIDQIGEILGVSANTILPANTTQHSNIIHNFGLCQFKNAAVLNETITDIELTNPAVVKVSGTSSANLSSSGIANGHTVFLGKLTGPTDLELNTYVIDEVNIANNSFILTGVDNSNGTPFVAGTVQNQTGPAVLLESAHGLNIDNAYVLTYGNYGLIFDLRNSGCRDFKFKGQFEAHPRIPILIKGSDVSAKVWQGADITLYNYSQINKDCVVENTGSKFIQLRDWNLKINSMGTPPTNKIFKNPNKLVMRKCRIEAPLANAFNPISSYQIKEVIHENEIYTDDNYIINNLRQEFSGDVDISGNISLPNGATSLKPSSPTSGQIFIDTDVQQTLVYRNNEWRNIESGGISTTAFTGAGPHTITSLTDNMIITVDHTTLAYVNIPSNIPAGWNAIIVHMGATGYSHARFTSAGTFVRQLPRTNGRQYDVVSLICLSNTSGSNPIVLVANGV